MPLGLASFYGVRNLRLRCIIHFMNSKLKTLLFILIAIGVFEWIIAPFFRDGLTAQGLSPDDRYRAMLVEKLPGVPKLDRNFAIRLEELASGKISTIFDSPDEGIPIGSERFIWSKDSTYLLLTGRHFWSLTSDIPLRDGSQAYFLYHLPSNAGWCNATQCSTYPRLTRDGLTKAGFADDLAN